MAEGYVAKITMLRFNIGSDMLRLSSCMLRLSLTSSVQGSSPRHSVCPPPPWTDEVRLSLSMHELSLSMPEPMLSLSMLILATYPSANSQHVMECSEHRSARSECSEHPEHSEHFWTLGTLFGYNTAAT